MSSRASRSKGKAEPKAAAAAAAAAPASPKSAPAKSRATRRKRGDDDESAAAATAPADDAPAPSEPKRARRGRGAADAAEPPARSPSPALSAAAADEDGSAEMSDAPRASPLDSLHVAEVGHMFSSAAASGRPALPLIVAHLTFDFLSAADIVANAAQTQRGWYATTLEYAKLVAHHATRASNAASSASSSAAAAAPSSLMIGVRSEVTTFSSIRAITLLLSSNLRPIVSGLQTRSNVAGKRNALFALDIKLVGRLAAELPSLRSLACQLSSSSPYPVFAFPPGLRSLRLEFCFFVAPHLSKKEREARASKPAPSWDAAKCDVFVEVCVARIAMLPHLLTLALALAPASSGLAVPRSSWIEPLVPLQCLRHLRCDFPSFHRSGVASVPLLRQMTQLVSLQGWSLELEHMLVPLLAPGHSLHLHQLDLEHLEITADEMPSLLTLADSLTDLNPHAWILTDLSPLLQFANLRRLAFFEDKHNISPSASHVVEVIEALPLKTRQRIDDLLLWYDGFSTAQFTRVLLALPRLTKLEFHSVCVQSLAAFSSAPSLASTLQSLRLRVPAVPRDDVSHLYSLHALTLLNFAGSFSEPLYAKQLFPFQPPYPKSPLRELRQFFGRSSNEPVPTPPVDLVARAAAYADFDARVRAGEVRPAELLNSAQLSGAFQFLSVADFSAAGRACRAWRTAAALPSAWGIANKADADAEAAAGEPTIGSGLWSSLTPFLPLPRNGGWFSGGGRVLHLSIKAPECAPGILPTLPLWRHARKLHLHLPDAGGYASGFANPRDSAALAAVAKLPRLGALCANFRNFADPSAIVAMMRDLGSQMRQLQVVCLPWPAYQSLSSLEELDIAWPESADFSNAACPGFEIVGLRRLRKLSLLGSRYNDELGSSLRKLSADHALRELSLGCGGYRDGYTGRSNAGPNTVFEGLFRSLAGEASAKAAAPAPAGDLHAFDALLGLDSDEPDAAAAAPASSVSSPALLEVLRVVWEGGAAPVQFPLSSVLRLPRLTDLHVHTVAAISVDLNALSSHVDRGSALPPLQKLYLSSTRVDLATLEHNLGRLTQLRELRLGEPAPAHTIVQPVTHWARKLIGLRQFEVLALNGVQIAPADLNLLDQLPNLRALSLIRQTRMQVSDLSVLPRLGLTELHLELNPLLLLQKRDWMREIGRQDVAPDDGSDAPEGESNMRDAPAPASASALAAASAADSAAVPSAPNDLTEGVLPLLGACRSLRVLRWLSPYALIQSNESYTARRTYVKLRGRVSAALQSERESNESARERQALRSLIATIPSLRVESKHNSKYASGSEWLPVCLAPNAGSCEESRLLAAASAASLPGRTYSRAPLTPQQQHDECVQQAIRDRAAMEAEREQESEWKAEADKQAAKRSKGRK